MKVPNKMMSNENVQEYHFAGAGVHPPITVKARSYDGALKMRNDIINRVEKEIVDEHSPTGSYEHEIKN